MTERRRRGRRTKPKPEWLIGLLIAIVVTAIGLWLLDFAGAGDDPRFEGEGASSAALADTAGLEFQLFNGTDSSFEELRGTPVVVNFWASWCPACIAEMPDFQSVSDSLGEQVVFLGLNMQDPNRAAAERLVQETGVTYLLAADPDGALFAEFGGIGMPTTVFVDANGNIVDTHSGVLSAEALEERIREAFEL